MQQENDPLNAFAEALKKGVMVSAEIQKTEELDAKKQLEESQGIDHLSTIGELLKTNLANIPTKSEEPENPIIEEVTASQVEERFEALSNLLKSALAAPKVEAPIVISSTEEEQREFERQEREKRLAEEAIQNSFNRIASLLKGTAVLSEAPQEAPKIAEVPEAILEPETPPAETEKPKSLVDDYVDVINKFDKPNPVEQVAEPAEAPNIDQKTLNYINEQITQLRVQIGHAMESGGGTVAVNYAAGGTIYGNLTVAGTISASQYLNLPGGGGASGAYLPLSGGTTTGSVFVGGALSSSDGFTALSANIGTNVVVGNQLYTDSIQFDTSVNNATALAGQLSWNNNDGTLNLGLLGSNVTLQVGEEMVERVVNKSDIDLLDHRYQVVRIRSAAEGGAQGNRTAVMLAQADTAMGSRTTLGLVTENIAHNEEGFITTYGSVHGINTTGSLQGETWEVGDLLYVSHLTAGALTKFIPPAPNRAVVVGHVDNAHNTQGNIFVDVQRGRQFDELNDVEVFSPKNGDLVTYCTPCSSWKNYPLSAIASLSALRDVSFTLPISAGSSLVYEVSTDKWTNVVIPVSNYLPLSGGTLTGPLTADNITTTANQRYATEEFAIAVAIALG